MIRASAPGRCGLVGNPTDGYGGTVISSALAERAVVELTPAGQILLDICGCQEQVAGPQDLALTGTHADIAKAVLAAFPRAVTERAFHLRATTNIPFQAGLAGSTAMLAALLGAVLRLLDLRLTPYEIAETIREIEFNTMKCVCGFQDQYMAVFGGLNYLDFRDKEPNRTAGRVYATVENLAPLLPDELPLLLANTGVQRHSGGVHHPLRDRWLADDAELVRAYERIAGLAREAKKALLSQDWRTVGAAMNENHAIQRSFGGSGEANERLITAALNAGALGAKLAGAGQGGTIIAVHEDPAYLAARLTEAGAAHTLPVVPSVGLEVEGEL